MTVSGSNSNVSEDFVQKTLSDDEILVGYNSEHNSKGNDDERSYVNRYFYRIKRKQQSVVVGRSSDTWNLVETSVKEKFKDQLIKTYGQLCCQEYHYGCGKQFERGELEIDHILSISNGGPVMDIGNMQLLCQRCHELKTKNHDNTYIENRVKIRDSVRHVYSC